MLLYYSKSKRNFEVCVSGNMAVCEHTGKNIKSTKISPVRDDMLVCNSFLSFEEFSVLANGTSGLRVTVKEIFLIHCNGLQFNKTSSQPP